MIQPVVPHHKGALTAQQKQTHSANRSAAAGENLPKAPPPPPPQNLGKQVDLRA